MANDWTPPSDGVVSKESSFTPPSDAVEVKKKDLTASGSGTSSSDRLSKTTTKPTASSSSKGKPDGIYSFPGQDDAIYKKENGEWYKAFKSDYKYLPITKGDVAKRIGQLENNAISLEQYSFEKPEPKLPEVPKEFQGNRDTIEYWKKLLDAGKIPQKTYDYHVERIQDLDFEESVVKAAAPKKQKPTTQEKEAQTLFESSFEVLDKNDPRYLKNKAEDEKIQGELKIVTPDLIGQNEDDVVPAIQKIIKDYPYLEVDYAGFGYDALLIRNKITKEEAFINLDNWSNDRNNRESEILRGFLEIQMESKKYVDQSQKVDEIKNKLADTEYEWQKVDLQKQLLEEQAKLKKLSDARYVNASNNKYKSAAIYDKNAKQNIKTDFARLQIQSIDYTEKAKDFTEWNNTVNDALKKGLITQEQYESDYAPKLDQERNSLISERDKINNDFRIALRDNVDIDNLAASEYAVQADRGNIITGTAYSFLEGAENSLRFLLETGAFDQGEFEGLLTQAAPGSISDLYTSTEGRNVLEQIVFGLANSGGSALVGAAIGAQWLGLYASSYVNMKDQMSTPEFANVPEYQKILMSGVYGATIGLLEGYGVSKWFQKTPAGRGLTNWILKRTVTELGKDATAEAIELSIKKNLGVAIKNGLIQVTASGLVEGSTELAQEAADMSYKDVFNKLNGKEYFDNPKSWAEVADRLSTSFILGFAGGAGMNAISQTTRIASNELNKRQINDIAMLIEDNELYDTFKLNLKDQILSGEISKEEAKRQIDRINELEGTLKKIPSNVDKFEAFKLITERDQLQKEIAGKDPALVAPQTERVNAINDELKQLSYAVQEQATGQVPVQPGSEVSGEMAQRESEARPQEVTQEGKKEEIVQSKENQALIDDYVKSQTEFINSSTVINQEEKQRMIQELESDPVLFAESKADITEFGDYFPHTNLLNSLQRQPVAQETVDKTLVTKEEIETKRKETEAKIKRKDLFDGVGRFSSSLGGSDMDAVPVSHNEKNGIELVEFAHPETGSVDVVITGTSNNDFVGFYRIYENGKPTNRWSSKFENQSRNKENFKTMISGVQELLPEGHEYTEKTSISTDGLRVWIQQLTKGYELQYDEKGNLITNEVAINGDAIVNELGIPVNKGKFENINVTSQADFQKVKEALLPYLEKLGLNESNIRWMSGPLKTSGTVKIDLPILKKSSGLIKDNQKETNFVQNETGKQKPGNRLFNEPLKDVAEIANRYHERVFGSKRPKYEGTTELNTERSKRIASAYEAMKNEPNNPEVKRAYEAMAKETIDQYQDFIDAGYVVEINNEEPYANSADMIEDLRKNKRIKIFSTESGFGDDPITPEQRAENPLLATTEFSDVNGQPMLVNDLFRAVHDFFGHAELGNSFGPKGEENAWNIHSRMYSPLARRAMTTETRGQNSWVNFSGFNDEIQKLRDKAAKLRDEGKTDEAAQVVDEIYEKFKFADQKIGLLPEEFSQVDEENILQADTKDATNLQKALDALDKIEKDLDQFGKETLGVNIPVALAKTIVKAVKSLVKAGVTLEQAIKQIAAEYNLSDRDVKSLLTPTKVSEIDVNEVRSKDIPGKRISKGLSVKTVAGKKVIEETEDLSIEYVKKNAPKAFVSNANIIAKYPLVAGKKKFKTATTVEQAQEIYDVFVREVADNLNYLMAEFKPEYREISTLWYDGANAIANDFADQFGVSAEQAAGIIAAMSPQKDWYQNVRLAEMVLMAYKDNPVMTKEMVDYQKGVNEKGLYDGPKSAGKKLKKAQKEYSESRTKANKETLEEAKVKMQESIEKADAVITMLNKYIGKNLNDVPAAVQPYMVRTYHEVNTTKDYNIVAPDGSVQGVAKKNNGAKAKVAWGSYSEIGKAVAIKNDGSQENITRSLGEMHKIRNFYNNIIDPMSKDGDVTMDTHAIAAALFLPLSGKSTQVGQNFGTKTANSAPLGIKGLYYAYADAYALAAKEAGLLPRQVQSITWEAVRGLYTDTFKGNKAEVAKINNIWKDYQDGKITIDEAREQSKESAGGIKDPTWAGPVQTEPGDGTGAQGVEGRGDGNERDIVGGTDGGGILTADTKDKTNLKKALDILNKADDDLAKFGRETLGINIPVATMRAIIKLAKVLVKTGITLQDAIIQAAEQKNVSKKDALNAIKFMVETINKPVKKVVVNEMSALKSQIRLEAKAAREAKGDLNTKRKALSTAIAGMVRQGKIKAVQARSIINKVSRVNLDNPVMVERLINYAEKVFDRADYQETLSKAAKIRKSIKRSMKSKDIQAEVVAMAKKFSNIDPFMVEDIDQYIQNAENVLNAVRAKKDFEVALRQAADLNAINEFSNKEIERQEANKRAELLALNNYLVEAGIITDNMTAKEIQEMIDIIAAQEYEVENADKKIEFLKNRFEFMSGIIKEMIVNDRDIFTDESLDLTPNQKEIMKQVLKIDMNEMSIKEAAQVLEAMDNFINNGITSGLKAVVENYQGKMNANRLAARGLKSRPLKLYFSKAIGRLWSEQIISLPLLVERMFNGMNKGLEFINQMGLNDAIRGAAKADYDHKALLKNYSEQGFYNEKGFMKAENVYERGMLAFLSRNLIGTKTEIRNEFLRRIKLVEESIDLLLDGTSKEAKIGEAYQKVYDKLKVDSQDLDVIKANADKMNTDAVDWMIKQWAEKYSELSDVSLSVYNSILGSDINYTPDRFKTIDGSDVKLDETLLERGGAFMNSLEYTDKNKSGVLMETTRPKTLPKERYVSLDFDANNFSSLKGAMVDIETAAAIRKIDGFMRAEGFKKMINSDDRKILKSRINEYIIKVKGKTRLDRDTMSSVERLANFFGSLGVGKALGGLDQAVKQTAPVVINTIINAGRFDALNTQMNEAINRSGMPIANRGLEASTNIEAIDSLIDKKGTKAIQFVKGIEKVSQMYMKALLSKPDVWVARSSFISYYKQYLNNNGISTDIDWQTHEWNQDAMDYAQMMVDRQQNISDEKLAGKFLSSSKSFESISRKVILPFATFILNQKSRMQNDFIAFLGKESSLEEKKKAARSIVGLSAELLTYQSIAYFIKTMVYDNMAAFITGDDDDEEKKERSFFGIKMTKKQWNATKFPVKSLISDLLSPFPLFDEGISLGFDTLMSMYPMISEEDIKEAVKNQNDARLLKGDEPMTEKQEQEFIAKLKEQNTYKVSFDKDSYGKQYGSLGIAFDTYTELAEMIRLASTGEFEEEMYGRTQIKHISKEDQETVKWTILPMTLFATGIVPKDFGVVSKKVVNNIKRKSINDTKFNSIKDLEKELGRKPKDWEEGLVINTKKKVSTITEAIQFAERFGGLTESQGKEYAKLIEVTGDYGYLDLKRIQDGETADQILKK